MARSRRASASSRDSSRPSTDGYVGLTRSASAPARLPSAVVVPSTSRMSSWIWNARPISAPNSASAARCAASWDAGRNRAEQHARLDQRAGLLAMHALELGFTEELFDGFEVDGLPTGHAARADGVGENAQHLEPRSWRESLAGAVRQHFEGTRLQCIADENRGGFVERTMAGGSAAAQIVVVHRGQIVVHQAVDVNEFDRGRRAHRASRATHRALRRWHTPVPDARACRRPACCSAWLRAGAVSPRRRSRARAPARLRCAVGTAERASSENSVARAREFSARSASSSSFLVAVGERFDRFFTIARQQYFDLLLRGAQRGLALAGERHAAFESLERFFERHVALFELRRRALRVRQRLFEVGRLVCRLGSVFWGFVFTRATLNVCAREGQTIDSPD